jgi:hypothetical protein
MSAGTYSESEARRLLGQMLASAKKAKLLRGIECDLERADLESLWSKQSGLCAMTGITFRKRTGLRTGWKNPFGPSLDRIDSGGSYTKRNVRLVCVIVNYIKSDFSDRDFYLMVKAAGMFLDAKKTAQEIGETAAVDGTVAARAIAAAFGETATVDGTAAAGAIAAAFGPGLSHLAARVWRRIKGDYASEVAATGRPLRYRVPIVAIAEAIRSETETPRPANFKALEQYLFRFIPAPAQGADRAALSPTEDSQTASGEAMLPLRSLEDKAADHALPLGDRPAIETWLRRGDGWECVETGERAASCQSCGGPLAPLCGFCPPEDRRG